MELTTNLKVEFFNIEVVYDVKDTKFEWNSQQKFIIIFYR